MHAVRVLVQIGPDTNEAVPGLLEASKGSGGENRREVQFARGQSSRAPLTGVRPLAQCTALFSR